MNSKKTGKTSRTATTTKSKKVKMTFPKESPSKGLGDTVEKVIKATGIKKAVKWLVGEDCGCDERRAKLNSLFRYKNPKCLTEKEYIFLGEFYKKNLDRIETADQIEVIKINNRVFNETRKPPSPNCIGCIRVFKSILNDLKILYNEYK